MARQYIYIDESGDLGLSKKSSNVLVMSALITDNPQQLDRIIKNTRRNKFRKELRKAKEIKFNKSSPELRKFLISKLNETTGCRAVHCIMTKERLHSHYLKGDKNKLYNFVAGRLASGIIIDSSNVEVRIDKSKGKLKLRTDFNQYFKQKLGEGSKIGEIRIFHSYSENFSGIQLEDILSGSTYQKYSNGDSHYLDIINPQVFSHTFIDLWK